MHGCGLVKGEGFAVDASVIEADASRYHGKAPDEINWSVPERQTRVFTEFLGGLDDDDPNADRMIPKVISPTDPLAAWTASDSPSFDLARAPYALMSTCRRSSVHLRSDPGRSAAT